MVIDEQNMAGKVCVCSIGRVGVVTELGEVQFDESGSVKGWKGFGLDGMGLWFSDRPIVIADSLKEYAQMVEDRPGNYLYG